MNSTLSLLQMISSPFEKATNFPSLDLHELSKLHEYSIKNRISLLYLKALKDSSQLITLESIYKKEHTRYLRTLNALTRVSKLLAEKNIEHAVFKSIRPYESTTVDIDIIIFGDGNEYIKSIEILRKAGYKLVAYGPRSTTLRDQKVNIGIDLYEQVAVSFITYIDKEELTQHIITTKLPNDECVKTLKPEADLACIIAHSVIKEQMYTLAEYYTFMYYLKQISRNDFLEIVKQNNITLAARTHMTITKLLHKAAHGTIPNELQQLLNSLGEENFETARLIKSNLETPHKYHPITIAKSLLEIAKGKKSRKSIAVQFFHMLNPKFTKSFAVALIDHVVRETY